MRSTGLKQYELYNKCKRQGAHGTAAKSCAFNAALMCASLLVRLRRCKVLLIAERYADVARYAHHLMLRRHELGYAGDFAQRVVYYVVAL